MPDENLREVRQQGNDWFSKHSFQILGVLAVVLIIGGGYLYLNSNPELGASLNFTNTIILVVVLLALATLATKMATVKPIPALSIFVVVILVGLFFNESISEAAINAPLLSKGLFSKYGGKIGVYQQELLKDLPPELLIFKNPTAEAPAERKINLEFINDVNRTPLEVDARARIISDEDLEIKVQCILDDVPILTNPTEIKLQKNTLEQSFPIRCSNSVGGKDLSVHFEAPFRSEAVQGVYVGSEDAGNKGKISSKWLHLSPYTLSLDIADPQPLSQRDNAYPLVINFARGRSDIVLKSLESLELNSLSPLYILSCSQPLEDLKFGGNREKLDQWVYDSNLDRFIFACQLKVNEAPQVAELSFINVVASYTIEQTFKTTLKQA